MLLKPAFLSLLRTSPLPATPSLTVCLGRHTHGRSDFPFSLLCPQRLQGLQEDAGSLRGPPLAGFQPGPSSSPPSRAPAAPPPPVLSVCARPRQQPVHSRFPRELPLWGRKPRNPGASCISRQPASARGGGDGEAAGGLTWLPGSLMRGDERVPGGFFLHRTPPSSLPRPAPMELQSGCNGASAPWSCSDRRPPLPVSESLLHTEGQGYRAKCGICMLV